MAVTHLFVSGIADGADATLVQPGDWNDAHVFTDKNVYLENPGSVSIITTGRLTQPLRLTLASTDRMTEAGTGRITISDSIYDSGVLRMRSPGSLVIMPDEVLAAYQRHAFYGNSRETIVGNGRTVMFDYTEGSRISLAGKG